MDELAQMGAETEELLRQNASLRRELKLDAPRRDARPEKSSRARQSRPRR